MSSAVDEDNVAGLLRRALKAVLRQTAATFAGYLSLDADDPVPKLLLPENVTVDRQLSRQLTQKVRREGRGVTVFATGSFGGIVTGRRWSGER